MDSGENPPGVRDSSGRFLSGCPGGPGRRPARSPIKRAISDDEAEELWRERVEISRTGDNLERRDRAAEFVLRDRTGRPMDETPHIPPIQWKRVTDIDAIVEGLLMLFTAHADGQIDSAGLDFGVRLLERAAHLLGLVETTRAARVGEQAQPYTIIVQAAVPQPPPPQDVT